MTTYLYQSDFTDGTYQLTEPGTYVLMEDIQFNPNPVGTSTTYGNAFAAAVTSTEYSTEFELDAYYAGRPLADQFSYRGGAYDPAAFGIGFFAAIAISADEIVLDLNGHTIEQGAEHALLQRFFAVLELADKPFIIDQGPHDFGDITIAAAENVTIMNGVIGRSSHHGIHGNANQNVTIKNVDFENYEVAAIALNGVQGLTVENVTAKSSEEVPVLGTFSNARFIAPYVDFLVQQQSSITLNVKGETLTAEDIQQALKDIINQTYADLITTAAENTTYGTIKVGTNAYQLFHNELAVVDGNSYGFLTNPLGVAVGGFPFLDDPKDDPDEGPLATPARDITFNHVHILSHSAAVQETVALNNGSGKAQNDAVGAILQLRNTDPEGNPITLSSLDSDHDGYYIGNAVADAQLLVAKAKSEFSGSHLSAEKISITDEVIAWAESQDPISELIATLIAKYDEVMNEEQVWRCNGDVMFHVNKGVIGFKIDGAQNVSLSNTSAVGVENQGEPGSTVCGDYVYSHPDATVTGYGGTFTRGYTFAGTTDVEVNHAVIADLSSASGPVIGFDILTDSNDIDLSASLVNLNAGVIHDAPPTPNPDPQTYDFQVGDHPITIHHIMPNSDFDNDGILNINEHGDDQVCQFFANDGDENLDLTLNVLDVVSIINIILDDTSSLTHAQSCHADVNNDATIDILDVVELTHNILDDDGFHG